MKLAAFPKAFIDEISSGQMPLPQWIEMGATLDVEGLELYEHFLTSFDAPYLDDVRTQLDGHGLSMPMLCCSPDFVDPDPAARRDAIDRHTELIRVARHLGGRGAACRVLSGQRHPGVSRKQGVAWVLEAFNELLPVAREMDVVLAMENHYKDGRWRYPEFAQRRDIFLEIVNAIDDRDHFGVQFDPSNALVAGDDPVDFLRTVADRVVTMQASDRALANGASLVDLRQSDGTLGYSPLLQHGVVGRGLNDYDAIFAVLREAGYDGWISIEDGVNGMDEMIESLAFLRRKISESSDLRDLPPPPARSSDQSRSHGGARKMMKAIVKYGTADREVEVRELPTPTPQPDRILVEVDAAGVCGSDIHMWRDHASWPMKLPLVLGHEVAGRVIDTGGVVGFSDGDSVVVETAHSVCGHCAYCLTGRYNHCPQRRGYGALADGGFTQYVLARPQIVHHIPAEVSADHAALAEPACVAYNAVIERVGVTPGDTVVVQGAGAIGVMAAQMARIAGAGHIVVIGTDLDETRLRVAQQVGATHVVNLAKDDPLDTVRTLGDGLGADLVVDATGVSAALAQSLDLVRPLGSIAKVGWGPQPLGFSLDPLVAKAVTLAGSFSHTWQTWERVLDLMATGALRLEPVIGGRYPVDEWSEAFAAMEDGRNVKSLLHGFRGGPDA